MNIPQSNSSTPPLFICNKAAECEMDASHCDHKERHLLNADCKEVCQPHPDAHCIPFITEPATPEPDYRAMWERLRLDLEYFQREKVHTTDPALVLSFMDYIEEVENVRNNQRS